MFNQNLFGEEVAPEKKGGGLAARWDYPPFSVLNAREGWWQERKRQWLSLGIKSELGRGATGVNSPHEGKDMADGLLAVRAAQKAARNGAVPGGGQAPADRLGPQWTTETGNAATGPDGLSRRGGG